MPRIFCFAIAALRDSLTSRHLYRRESSSGALLLPQPRRRRRDRPRSSRHAAQVVLAEQRSVLVCHCSPSVASSTCARIRRSGALSCSRWARERRRARAVAPVTVRRRRPSRGRSRHQGLPVPAGPRLVLSARSSRLPLVVSSTGGGWVGRKRLPPAGRRRCAGGRLTMPAAIGLNDLIVRAVWQVGSRVAAISGLLPWTGCRRERPAARRGAERVRCGVALLGSGPGGFG